MENTFTMPLVAGLTVAKDAIRRMQIDGPASIGYGIWMLTLLNHILLCQDIIAFKPTAFSLSGNHSNPFQCEGIGFRKLS
ncbi:hypothetical protein D3C87_713460 [compost metagenome]